jgi:hypothetical protein
MLAIDDFLIGNEAIDIAKGKYELTANWKEIIKQRKRCRIQGKI